MNAANELINRGYAPYVPLLNHFIQQEFPQTEHQWLKLDFEYLPCCDILIRLKPIVKGEEISSPGADREEEYARSLKIPVFSFNTIDQMCVYLDEHPFEKE
jgi:hypothetical protein